MKVLPYQVQRVMFIVSQKTSKATQFLDLLNAIVKVCDGENFSCSSFICKGYELDAVKPQIYNFLFHGSFLLIFFILSLQIQPQW